jgi:hypothetical protein
MNPCHDAPGNHAPALLRQLPRRGHPHHCVALCGMASNNLVALCHPLPYGRRAAPSKKDSGALEGKTNDHAAPTQGQRRDVGPAGPVTPVAICPVRPSPPPPTPSRPLHHRPRRYGSMRRQDPATPATVPRTASRRRCPQVLTRAATKQATPTPPPSKPLLDAHRTRHDALLEARFTRTAVSSTTLYTMPLHVDEIVRHACKLSPPWPIKGGAVP